MRLRVATFNVENLDEPPPGGRSLDERIAVLRPQLLALRADVLCLQEVSARLRHGGQRALRALDQLVEGTPYAAFERAASHAPTGRLADIHNLVVLSRLPIVAHRQLLHDLVEAPVLRLATAPTPRDEAVRWDRPILEVHLGLPDGRPLIVFDVHLRAPRAAAIAGQKLTAQRWRTVEGWAEGYLLSAIKRAGQALELRRRIDQLFDADAAARILVAGDLNADVTGSAYAILRASVEDTGNPALAGRSLIALEERISDAERYTVIHDGRRSMLDHLLASASLASGYAGGAILNGGLLDEVEVERQGIEPAGSLHAPLVVELEV
jgi:endonuclease/exonuclease/phosphatase family metal-dependent hydrolase